MREKRQLTPLEAAIIAILGGLIGAFIGGGLISIARAESPPQPTRLEIPGGTYTEALPDGSWASLVGDHLESSEGRIDFPEGGAPLFLTIYRSGGTLYVAGKAHGSGQGLLWSRSRGWTHLGPTYGNSPVGFDRAGAVLFRVEGIHRYALHGLAGEDRGELVSPNHIGSLGIRYLDAGNPVTGDQTYYSPDLRIFEWTRVGSDLACGQGSSGGVVCVRGQDRYLIEPGETLFVRASTNSSRLALATWKLSERKAVIHWVGLDQLGGYPQEPLPEVIKDPDIPEVDDPPPPRPDDPPSILPVVQAARQLYGPSMTNDQAVELLNRAAWAAGNGWGLLRKESGNNGRRKDGVLTSVDWLVHRPSGRGLDALGSAGDHGPTIPQWGPMVEFDVQKWVAPIDPGDPVGSIDPPPPPKLDLTEVHTRLDAIIKRLDTGEAQHGEVKAFLQLLMDQLTLTLNKLCQERDLEIRLPGFLGGTARGRISPCK